MKNKPESGKNSKGYNVLWWLLARPIRALFRLSIVGLEKLPSDEGCILSANHTSLLDVLILSVSTGRQIRYMAKAELFKIPLLKQLITALGAYPVNRGGADVSSIRRTLALLEAGAVVGIFPQGTRHGGKDPSLTPVKGGIGMIAWHGKATIVPAFIKTKGNRVRLFKKTELIIGDPIPFDALGMTKGGREEYQKAAETVFASICELGGYSRSLPEGEEESHE